MYARVVTFQGSPTGIDAVLALVQERAKPELDAFPGHRGMSTMVDRENGRVVVVSAWATEQARQNSADRLAPLRAEAAELMSGTVHLTDYVIAVQEQAAPTGPGACMRATALAGDPARMQDGITSFQAQLIPALRGVPGFCGAALLLDPTTGRAVGTTFWRDRDALLATREMAESLRATIPAASGSTVTGIAEYDVVIDGIAVPEHEHLMRVAYECMSAGGDLDALDALTAPDLVEHLPDGRTGGNDVKASLASVREAFPDLRMTIQEYVEDGDTACAVIRFTGTHQGPLFGNAPTGRAVDVMMVDVVRFRDGRAVEHWGAGNDLVMLAQLGITTAPSAEQVLPQQTVDLTQPARV